MPAQAADAAFDAAALAAMAPWPLTGRARPGEAPPESPRPAELEGRPGHVVPVRLRSVCRDEHLARILIPPTWQALDLPLARVTSLRLQASEPPRHSAPGDCVLTLAAGEVLHLHALALTEHPLGLFLVLPRQDPAGCEYRFYPREAWRHVLQGQAGVLDACDSPDGLRQALRDTPPGDEPPRVDVLRYPIDEALLKQLGYERALALGALPLGRLDGGVVVVVDTPAQRGPLRELGFLFGCRIDAVRPAAAGTAELIQTVYDRHRLAPAKWFD